ncbi:MAG: acyl-CoA dehydrogenase family protein [Salinirussus sp.]
MDLGRSDRAAAICEEVETVIADEVAPITERHNDVLDNPVRKLDDEGLLVDDLVDAYREVVRIAGDHDLLGLQLPESAGGRGLSYVEQFHVRETVFEHGTGLSRYLSPIAARGPTRLLLALSDEKRREYLDPLLSGEKTACLGLTEPRGGSDVGNMATTAERQDDGSYRISGHKKFVGNGPYADFVQLFATTDPDAGVDGITGFLVDMDQPGIERGPTNRDAMDKGEWCELLLDECEVPSENVIGEPGEGLSLLLPVLNKERVMMAAQSSGLATYVNELSIEYANRRETWGRPIGTRQGVQFPLADAAIDRQAIRLLGLWAAWCLDNEEAPATAAAMAKVFATEALADIADTAVGVHGGDGMMKDGPFWQIYNQARAMQIYEGTNEILRRNIARDLGLDQAR